MIKPPTPVDELLRLETLRKLKILDTDPEERFDRFTRLAKHLFGIPIVLVSLVDANRQWFKSRQGLSAKETTREISFCGHAICQDDVLVVADAMEDERFADNPLVTNDPNIRFYAGCPLSGPDGHKVGTLCLIDSQPRTMTSNELSLLEELGKMVEEELVIADFLRIDPTTGFSNRAGFELIADHMLGSYETNRVPASLIFFHHTNHESIHATMGSGKSDRATVELAQLLLATFSDFDVLGRLSADTFAVLVSGPQHHNMDDICQKFFRILKNRNEKSDSGYEMNVDICSTTYRPDRHPRAEALVQAAEDLLGDSASADDCEAMVSPA